MSEPHQKTPHLLDINGILQMLPHRYPFLMVDRVLAHEPGVSITALKNVTINEPFFQGHFPNLPVMPGVMILESLAQAGGLLVYQADPEGMRNKIFVFSSMEKVRFRKPVYPGDCLELSCTDVRHRFNIWKMTGAARVGGEVVAEATLSAAVVAREDF